MEIEGYVKFNCDWKKSRLQQSKGIRELIRWRQRLFRLGLIGVYQNGDGFGNVSVRASPGSKEFLITGTRTGGIPVLTLEHITRITDVDLEKNYVACRGPIEASSESMTHEAVYRSDRRINAVFHVHNKAFWKRLLWKVPTTSKAAKYGTPALAREVRRLFEEDPRIWEAKLIALAGHEEGVISFGKTIEEAGDALLQAFSATL